MKLSEIRLLIRKILKEDYSFTKLDLDILNKIWAEQTLYAKRKVALDFLRGLPEQNIKISKIIRSVEAARNSDEIDRILTNLYLKEKGLGVGRGTPEELRTQRKKYLKRRK